MPDHICVPEDGRPLSVAELDAIRNMPCGNCGAVPLFDDGSRCHPHRIIPGSKGGQYVEGNVVSRCPPCRDAEHGGNRLGLILLSRERRAAAGRRGGAAGRGRAPWNKGKRGIYSAETRRKISAAKKGQPSHRKGARHSPESRAKMSTSKLGQVPWNKGKRGVYSPEALAAMGASREGKPCRGMHVRWHVKRGVVNADCPFCVAI